MENENQNNINEGHIKVTSLNNGHIHTYFIEDDGDGETLSTVNIGEHRGKHTHVIESFNVLEEEDHTHDIFETGTIEEVEPIHGCVQEIRFILNTGNEAQVEHLTDIINGKLLGIIIESDGQINLRISLEKYDDIVIYENQGFSGSKYLSLINDGTYPNNERVQNYGRTWVLNDRLRIHVDGGFNSIVKFSVRYK